MKEIPFNHTPVLLQEVIEGLCIRENGIYVDGTLGGAGHALCVCRKLGKQGRFVGIDQDEAAIQTAKIRLKEFGDTVQIIRNNYCNMKEVLEQLGIGKVNGILLDLGVSSHQLDTADRGFSYRMDAPLDMRMDKRQKLTAREVVNTYTEQELFHIIRRYGEDNFAKNIARHICMEREKKEIETTGELSEVIGRAIPMKIKKKGGHPAKRTFQAIRIEVNNELGVLEQSLSGMIDLLEPGGRLCVITFHSLEDRMVKTIFRDAENPCTCPPDFPVCVCGRKPKGHMVSKKPVLPSEKEREENPRAKSAKLRIFEKK